MWDEPTPIEFAWKKMDKATQYRLTVSKEYSQKNILKTQLTADNTVKWPWKSQGSYYWSVTALDKKSIAVGQSEIRLVNIKMKPKTPAFALLSPKTNSEVLREMSDNPEPVLFQWQTLKPLPGPVTLLVSQKEDFSQVFTKEKVTQLSLGIPL
jgi:hypothetical protein